MEVLVDTSIWSLLLRRTSRSSPAASSIESVLRRLVTSGRAVILGPVRQELLTGIRSATEFNKLRDYLRLFPDQAIETEDFETAAEYANACTSAGVQGTPTDMLICAVAIRRSWEVLTRDRDFDRYAAVLPLHLHRDYDR
jgi:predicted nucleic acid-binding protein